MYSVARYGKEFACFSSVSNALLSKCAKFLKYEVSRNYRILSEFQKDDFELFQMLVGWGSGEGSLEEEDSKELQDDDFWGWGGVFPLEELPQEDDRVQDLPMTSSARQKGIISCTTRMTAAPKELTCFSSYDRYSRCKHEETMDLFVGEVFEKYMLKSTEPFLFYCSIPPYTRQLFNGSTDSPGFLNIEWAEFVHIILLEGSISCIVSCNLVRMEKGDVLRFDTSNTAGLWNYGIRKAEILVVAHE
ncbi:uncharacterized protein LOC111711681 isoform X2 [Eurytemora carolleeae]|uniref:uncharacterized protein LOC111711681 isoform X2 n=1 Tax=Eurytemora carolleeae TaxID=1294199 RepID=UPI000C768D50|nr:uncharacterized protein LOC111711681 isoform X2 [Eurytemora carolleeae]|eukprot:XP_023341846.1 uncharacterized protein LOC111711681 isoform X2 [Eurytemora affinis]